MSHKGKLRKTNPKYDPKVIKRQDAEDNDVFYFYEQPGKCTKVKIVCHEFGCRAEIYKNNSGKSIICGETVINESSWLTQIDVDSGFQRRGIATAMIKVLIKIFPDFKVPYHGNSIDNDDLYLTADGKHFIKNLIDKGILEERHWDLPVPFASLMQFG